MDEETLFPYDADLDFSFTSTTTDRTFASSSARSSLARSSLTLSFNESRLSTTASSSTHLQHRKWDPHWSAIKAATNLSSDGTLHLRHLKLVRQLGTGNLGRVFLCRLRDCTTASFALKVIDRDTLSKKKLSHVQTETRILSMLDHPFLPTLYYHIEASHYTCLLIDYCPNGDLHSLLRKQPGNRLPVHAVKFFAAEVLVALEYLHALGIIYRDLKPENILLREDGHVMLSDFDLCFETDVIPMLQTRVGPTKNRTSSFFGCLRRRPLDADEVVAEFTAEPTTAFSSSCVGTHEYLAPELLWGNGHGNGVDWWAFGVLIYELLLGTTPFKGDSKESTLRNIASRRQMTFHVAAGGEAEGMEEAKDLIEKLLVKDPRRRLGRVKGATEIKRHPFFDGIKWPLIKNYMPPDVRGLAVRRGKTHVADVIGISTTKRPRWWKARKALGNTLNCNSNYFRYKLRTATDKPAG